MSRRQLGGGKRICKACRFGHRVAVGHIRLSWRVWVHIQSGTAQRLGSPRSTPQFTCWLDGAPLRRMDPDVHSRFRLAAIFSTIVIIAPMSAVAIVSELPTAAGTREDAAGGEQGDYAN